MDDDPNELFRAAFPLWEAGKIDEAIALLKDILKRHPDSGVTWAILGRIYDDQGCLEESTRAFEQAVTHSPRSGLCSAKLFFLHLHGGDNSAALDEIERYFGLSNDDAYDMFFRECFDQILEQNGPVEEEREFVNSLIEIAIQHRGEELSDILNLLDYPYSGQE